jgi:putative membrane protein
MRIYDPKQWFDILFQFHKSDTLRKLFKLMIIIALYTGAVVYLLTEVIHIEPLNHIRNLSLFHTLLGFALSLLLVFRTNTAYDKWWEGRKLWGALTNNSRNLAIKLQTMIAPTDHHNRDFFKKTIPLYGKVLKDHLRSEETRYMLDETDHPELTTIDIRKHIPNHY